LTPLSTGRISHELAIGGEYGRTVGKFTRRETTYVFRTTQLSADILCGDNTFDCVENEQFFTERQVYDAGASTATLDQFAIFFDDRMHYRRLELRPGLRLSYDDLMGNTNLAPRLAAAIDLFGSGDTYLIAGINRYYGNTLLTDKLREAKNAFRTETRAAFRNRPLAWEPGVIPGVNVTRFAELETPYSDEIALGLDQALGGGRLSLKYVHREGHDEFARSYSPLQPDGLRYYTLNNNGRSRHDSYRTTWERSWNRHFLSLNATWQETTTSNEGYDTILENEELGDQIWYQGELIRKSDLPGSDFNRPVIVNLIWVAALPHGFTFTNVTRFRSGYNAIEGTGELRAAPGGERSIDPLTGEEIFTAFPVYEKTRYDDSVIFDWKVQWQSPAYRSHHVLLSLEANNIFNARTRTGGAARTFEMGRQFWAGVDYRF
jgi:outer membrane receptor protein involved in Fe transport